MPGGMKLKWGCLIIAGLLLAGLCGCGQQAAPTIADIKVTNAISAAFEPAAGTGQLDPGEPLFLAIKVNYARPGDIYSVKWYFETAKIEETFYTVDHGGSGWIAFRIANDAKWPSGTYYVDIFNNDQFIKRQAFSILK
jgi:hypothetical protein